MPYGPDFTGLLVIKIKIRYTEKKAWYSGFFVEGLWEERLESESRILARS